MENLRINIKDSGVQNYTDSMVVVGNHGRLVVTREGQARMGVTEGEYVLLGEIDGHWYICKKPTGFFGYKLKKPGNSNQLTITAKTVRDIPKGRYNFGNVYIDQDGIAWFPMTPVE